MIGSALGLGIFFLFPWKPDLSDWGARVYPMAYLIPLIIVFLTSYGCGWISAKFIPKNGRLVAMITGIVLLLTITGLQFSTALLKPLFHHPAYPTFSDHVLLASAIVLVGTHTGGLRVEKGKAQT